MKFYLKSIARRSVLISLSFTAIALAACDDKAEKKEQISQLAWSEDGTEIAYVMSRFEEEGAAPSVTHFKHDFSHQVYVQNADGSNVRKIGNEQGLENLEDFYYHKAAGYMVVSYLNKPLGEPAFKRYYQLKLDGKSYTITTKPNMSTVPSPNGQVIATVTQFPEGCKGVSSSGADSCHAMVDFLNASDLKKMGNQIKVTFASRDRLPDFTWTSSGDFVVSNGFEAFSLAPGADVKTRNVPACMSPKTNSSSVNQSGQVAYAEGSTAKVRLDPSQPQFGCQG